MQYCNTLLLKRTSPTLVIIRYNNPQLWGSFDYNYDFHVSFFVSFACLLFVTHSQPSRQHNYWSTTWHQSATSSRALYEHTHTHTFSLHLVFNGKPCCFISGNGFGSICTKSYCWNEIIRGQRKSRRRVSAVMKSMLLFGEKDSFMQMFTDGSKDPVNQKVEYIFWDLREQ